MRLSKFVLDLIKAATLIGLSSDIALASRPLLGKDSRRMQPLEILRRSGEAGNRHHN